MSAQFLLNLDCAVIEDLLKYNKQMIRFDVRGSRYPANQNLSHPENK